MTAADPTGERFRLARAGSAVTAEICQVGGALRALTVDGVDLVPRYPDGIPTPAASGVVLVPWPNRVRDGSWAQHGQTRQLAISEPKLGNASHGLLRFSPYTRVTGEPDRLTLAATVYPQTGYPFQLDTSVTYALTDGGLRVSHTIVNVGAQEAPVALGAHPYLCIGDVDTAELRVSVAGETFFELDDRKLPIAQSPVDGAHDLRTPRRVGELAIDSAFGDLPRDGDDRISGHLIAPDGRRLTLWAGSGFEYLQVFTTDRYPGHDVAVAIEPMTAPADAFNSGTSLRWLASGERWDLEWGIAFERHAES